MLSLFLRELLPNYMIDWKKPGLYMLSELTIKQEKIGIHTESENFNSVIHD